MPEAVKMSSFEGRGLLDLFWDLADASPKRRTQAACNLVRHLLQGAQTEDTQGDDQRGKGKKQLPGVAAVDAQKMQSMLKAPEGTTAVPYDLQYAVNRLFQGLASPRPCTRQAYALALLLLLLQLQQQKPAIAGVNLLGFCQNLRRVFTVKQAAPSEVKQLHLGRCLGVYILLCLGFFKKKQSLPEVQEVLEMLWQAFHGKLQLQEASGCLIRKVLRQLAEAGQGEIGLATCEPKLRGVGIPHLLAQMENVDKTKAAEVGKTATGRLPCSLLEVYVHLQADMQEGLLPDAEWLHTDVFNSENLPNLVAFLSDTAAAHPRLHGLWSGVMRLLLLRSDAEEVFQRFWVAVDTKLFPYKGRGSDGPDTGSKRPQEQSHQSAFVGIRAALLILHIIKQRLLLLGTADDSTLTEVQLQRMASLVFTKGKGFLRVFLFHLESPRSPLHAVARYTAERLEEVFGHPVQFGASRRHPLSVSSSNGDGGDRGFVKTRQLSSMCCLSCGCQADPYMHGLLEPLLEETRDEAGHLQPFGEDYRVLSEPLRLQPDERVAMLLAFGAACRFQPLKRQSLWSLGSICFSSAQPDELKGLAMLLLAALNEAPSKATALAEEEKGLVGRKTTWLLDCLLLLPQLLGSKNAEGSTAYLPDWLLAAALCSSSFAVRIVPAQKALSQSQLLAAAVELSELSEPSQPTTPEGMDDIAVPLALVRLPELFLFGLGTSGINGTKHFGSKGPFSASAASSRIRGKICHLLGSFCSIAMERCTRMDGDASSDFAQHLHGAHALLFQLMEREKAGAGGELQLRGRAISVGERGRQAKVLVVSNGGSAMRAESEDMDELRAVYYFTSSQGAAVAAAANAAAEGNGKVHAGFIAAAQVLCMAICALSLLPYVLLPGGNDGSGTSGDGHESEDDEIEPNEAEETTGINGAAASAAKAFAAPETKGAEIACQEESEEVLDAALHALRQMMQVIKPLYTYVHLGDQKYREAAIAAQGKAAAISSNLLLLGGSSAASGLLREIAGGLWRCFSCFAPTGSITKLLGVATATSSAPNAAEEESLEDDQSEPETASESEESEESESGEDEQEDESSPQKQKLSAESTKSKRNSEDGGASSSSDESDGEDPFALQLSPDAALKALADDSALPDAYCPPGGFKERRVSQRKLLLQQRRRFGELRLRALGALQVYVQYNGSNPLALHVLTSLYAAFSRVLVQAAQSRKRKQNLAVYDDLTKKIRRTIELALKGTITNAWQINTSSTAGSSDNSKPHRKTSSISLCYQTLQEQRLQVLLQKAAGSSQKEQKRKPKETNHQLQVPPLMPTLEDGDRMQVLLEGKEKNPLLCDSSEAAKEAQIPGSVEYKRLFLAQTLWALLAEEMVNVLRVCSRKLPPQLAGLNQTLGVEMLLQLSKLEQQVYGYYAATSAQNPAITAAVSKKMIITQLLSVALSARSQLRRCHLGGSFFETLAERRPDIFRFCDVYASALRCRAPFVRRELAQVAFRAYKQPVVDHPGASGASTEELDLHVLQKRLSTDYILTSLLSKGRSGEVGRKQLPTASNCEPILTPNKALRSSADFAIFVIRRLVGLLKEISEAEVRPPQQQPDTDDQQQKRRKKRQQPTTPAEENEDGASNEDHKFVFGSTVQKQAAVCEHLKQLQQLLQTFARRDRQEASASEGSVQLNGFKEKLQGHVSSIEQTLVSAAEAAGGKKPTNLANTIRALLSRIAGTDSQDNPGLPEGGHRAKIKREAADETGKPRKKHKEQSAKDSDGC